jgi:hypothetical protein
VFKGGLSRTGTEQGLQFRYFSSAELHEMFAVEEQGLAVSETQVLLHRLHAGQRIASEGLQQHLRFLETLEGFTGGWGGGRAVGLMLAQQHLLLVCLRSGGKGRAAKASALRLCLCRRCPRSPLPLPARDPRPPPSLPCPQASATTTCFSAWRRRSPSPWCRRRSTSRA